MTIPMRLADKKDSDVEEIYLQHMRKKRTIAIDFRNTENKNNNFVMIMCIYNYYNTLTIQ